MSAPDGSFRGVLVAAISIANFEKNFSTVTLDYVRPIGVYMSDGTLVASVTHELATPLGNSLITASTFTDLTDTNSSTDSS